MSLKKIFALALVCLSAAVCAETEIIGTIPNKGGGAITFMAVRGDCPPGQLMAYTQSSGGKIELTGCFRILSKQLLVIWSDGDAYTYPVSDVKFSDEFLEELRKKKPEEKPI